MTDDNTDLIIAIAAKRGGDADRLARWAAVVNDRPDGETENERKTRLAWAHREIFGTLLEMGPAKPGQQKLRYERELPEDPPF